MGTIKKTYAEIQAFRGVAESVTQMNKEKETKDDIRLKFALKKMLNKTKAHQSNYQEQLEEKRVDLCLTDSEGAVVIDKEGKYKFTPENSKKVAKEAKKLSEKEVEIEPHIVSIPKDFPFSVIQYLEGFVFKEVTEEEMLKALEK
jgi:hypothetical protein